MNRIYRLGGDAESSSIGKLLLDSGKIREKDIEVILNYAKKKDVRFGEAAIKLKLVTKEDIEHVVAIQFEYPYLMKNEGGFGKELVAAYKPFSDKVEGLRILRGQLMLSWISIGRKSIAITSSGSKEGRSFITANLAIVFSQLGERTLIIDADLLHARQHKIFKVNNSMGLSSLLVGRSSTDEAVRRVEAFKDLSVLPAGAPPPNPQELLSRSEFPQILAELGRDYDVILLDTSAGNTRGGATTVAKASGCAIFIARRNKTNLSAASAFVSRIRNSKVEVIGSVLNNY